MNKREESKIKTRELILVKTKELIAKIGVLNLTTAVIAKECGIAHGSVFQHFGSREGLINTVLGDEIKRLTVQIESCCDSVLNLDKLLENYLEVLSQEEDFFSMLYRELPFLPEEIQKNMVCLEVILRNSFFFLLHEEGKGEIDEKGITIRMEAFFSTVIRYLSLRELYSPDQNVIKAKSADIKKLFEILFERECIK